MLVSTESFGRYDIVVLTETWIYPYEEGLYGLEGYRAYFCSNAKYRSGGVVIYVKERFPSCAITSLHKNSDCLVVDVSIGKTVLRVAGCYRSPTMAVSNPTDFCSEDLSEVIHLLLQHREAIFCGDLNFDLMGNSDSTELYRDMLSAGGFIGSNDGAVTRPSGVGGEGSIIDHVFCRLSSASLESCETLELFAVTDHNGIHTMLRLEEAESRQYAFWHVEYERLKLEVAMYNWDSVVDSSDPNVSCLLLQEGCKKLLSKCSNLKVTPREHWPTREWMTCGLVRCVRKRNKLFAVWKKTGHLRDKLFFLAYKNRLRGILRNAKDEYYREQLERYRSDSRKVWQTVNRFFRGKKRGTALDPNVVKMGLNDVNSFFGNMGRSAIGENFDRLDPLHNLPHYTTTLVLSVFRIPSVGEIKKLIGRLGGGKAGGEDGIKVRMLRQNVETFSRLLQHVVKLIFATGIYPTCLKLSKLYPIHKSGPVGDIRNYRPISLLSTIDKIIEKIISGQITDHLSKSGILSDKQFGFRKGRGCEDAAIKLLQAVSSSLEDGEHCAGIFLDLGKAFDTIHHQRLINKLCRMGIKDLALDVLSSYLRERHQIFEFDGVRSESYEIQCGVPQGSVLGPLLFILYTNDFLLNEDGCEKFCFADDTALIVRTKNPTALCSLATEAITTAARWLQENGLVLNSKKTKFIIFANRPVSAREKLGEVEIRIHKGSCRINDCDCPRLSEVTHIRYLGLIIQNDLKFDRHIEYAAGKMRAGVAVLGRVRYSASPKLRRSLYSSLIESHVRYMITIYGGTFASTLDKIIKLQKRAIRLAMGAKQNAPSDPIFKSMKILNFDRLYCVSILLKMYRYIDINAFPDHQHNTRFKKDCGLLIPRAKKECNRRSPAFMFIKIYNWLPEASRKLLIPPTDPDYRRLKTEVKKMIDGLETLSIGDIRLSH